MHTYTSMWTFKCLASQNGVMHTLLGSTVHIPTFLDLFINVKRTMVRHRNCIREKSIHFRERGGWGICTITVQAATGTAPVVIDFFFFCQQQTTSLKVLSLCKVPHLTSNQCFPWQGSHPDKRGNRYSSHRLHMLDPPSTMPQTYI